MPRRPAAASRGLVAVWWCLRRGARETRPWQRDGAVGRAGTARATLPASHPASFPPSPQLPGLRVVRRLPLLPPAPGEFCARRAPVRPCAPQRHGGSAGCGTRHTGGLGGRRAPGGGGPAVRQPRLPVRAAGSWEGCEAWAAWWLAAAAHHRRGAARPPTHSHTHCPPRVQDVACQGGGGGGRPAGPVPARWAQRVCSSAGPLPGRLPGQRRPHRLRHRARGEG